MKIFRSILLTVILVLGLVNINPVFAQDNDDNDELSIQDKLTVQHYILSYIRNSYVDTSVTLSDVMDGAIRGMMDELDPHSSFLPVDSARDFNERIRGNFEGIGISFGMIDEKITVIEVIPGGPSEAAGIKSRDKIIKVDDADAVGVDNDRVKELLRGPAGSQVTVYVERPGEKELLPFTLTRDRVDVNSVSQAFMVNPETGYIKVTKFSTMTHYDVHNALMKLRDQGMERLVLDLRSNSGGSLDAAINVVDKFISEKGQLIVETRGRKQSEDTRSLTSGEGEFGEIPMIVMVNHGSASASEVVSGALQDHDRALIVGQTSFGKGLVMKPHQIRSKQKRLGTLLLSTAHYYTPSGRLIQRPYDKGREEYIKEGYDDYDPNAVDSLRTDLPAFTTDLGREVFGGGGITPDFQLEPLRRLNPLERQLRASNVFFEFADAYLLRHDDIPSDFIEFRDKYNISDREVMAFREFIEEKDIKTDRDTQFHDDLNKLIKKYEIDDKTSERVRKELKKATGNLDEKIFSESKDFIRREIKSEIARMIWGSEERYRVWQVDDTELIGAMSYFSEAEDLLSRRLALTTVPDDQR